MIQRPEASVAVLRTVPLSGDVTVIQKRRPRKLEPGEYGLLTMIPAGVQPNNVVVKAFMVRAGQ